MVPHAYPIPQYRAARKRAGRVDRENPYFFLPAAEFRCQATDESALSRPRASSDPDDVRAASARVETLQDGFCQRISVINEAEHPPHRAQITVEDGGSEIVGKRFGGFCLPI